MKLKFPPQKHIPHCPITVGSKEDIGWVRGNGQKKGDPIGKAVISWIWSKGGHSCNHWCPQWKLVPASCNLHHWIFLDKGFPWIPSLMWISEVRQEDRRKMGGRWMKPGFLEWALGKEYSPLSRKSLEMTKPLIHHLQLPYLALPYTWTYSPLEHPTNSTLPTCSSNISASP